MELAKIEKLVVKYENAETTLREEQILRDYFVSDNVAPHLQEYQMMFVYFQKNQGETYNKTIQLKSKKAKKLNWKWLSVAASIALLVSVYFGKEHYEKKKVEAQFAQVQNALMLLSTNLKKGDKAFENLYVYENTVNKIFKNK